MLVAAWTVHKDNGFFIVKEGWEYNLVLAASAVGIATIGAGRLSLDYLLFRSTGLYDLLHGWWGLLIALVLGLAGGIGQLVIFYRPAGQTERLRFLRRADTNSHSLGDERAILCLFGLVELEHVLV